MKSEESGALEANMTSPIQDLERQIRLLRTLRQQANLEAAAHHQLARIAALQSDVRALRSCDMNRKVHKL